MAVAKLVWDVLENQQKQVLLLNNPRLILEAKNIAFYAAMIDAAEDDPMSDPEEQIELLTHFRSKMYQHVQVYQDLVNNLM